MHMLPTMKSFTQSSSALVVRIGPLQLFFSYEILIAFQIDGNAPVVCENVTGRTTTTDHLLRLEPDKSKWLSQLDFTRKWLQASKMVFKVEVAV
jgi:hypothetical protein